MYRTLPEEIESVGKEIVDIAYNIHKQLGPGLLESIYKKCFCHELGKRALFFERQKRVSILFDGIEFEEGLRLDILVEQEIVVELKAHENAHAVWEAQLLSYLKLSNKKLGFLINFHVPLIRNGIKRIIL